MDNFSGIHIGGGPMSSDFRDRGGGGVGGGVGHLEEFAALDGSTHAHAAADDFGTDLFCFLVEGVLIMVGSKKQGDFVQSSLNQVILLNYRSLESSGSWATAFPC